MTQVQWRTYGNFALIFPLFCISVFVSPFLVNVIFGFNSTMLLVINLISVVFLVNGVTFLHYTWGGEFTVVTLDDGTGDVYQLIDNLQSVLDISRVTSSPDFLFTHGDPIFRFGDASRERLVFMIHRDPRMVAIHISRHAFDHRDEVARVLEEMSMGAVEGTF